MLAAGLLVNRAGTMVLPFLTLYLTTERGYGVAEAGRLLGLFGLGSVAGSWLGGWLSDRIDPNRVQRLSLAATGAGFLVLPWVPEREWLALAVFVIGALGDVFRPALFVAASRYRRGRSRVRAFALMRLAGNLGMTVGPAIGGILAAYRYELLFVVDGLTCWAAAVVLAVGLGRAPAPATTPHFSTTSIPARSVWSDLPFLAFLLLVMGLAVALFQIFSTLPIYLRDVYGLLETAIGGLLAINAALIALFEMVLLRAVEDRDHLRMTALGAVLVCLGLAVLPFGPPLAVAILGIVVLTFGEMLALPMSNALVAEHADERSTGQYMGAYSATYSLALVISPVAGTFVYDRFGGDALWWVVGAVGPLLALGFRLLSPQFLRETAPEIEAWPSGTAPTPPADSDVP